MTIYPYQKIVLHTHLPQAEVLEQLKSVTEPVAFFRIFSFPVKHGNCYEGEIMGNNFAIQEIKGPKERRRNK
jgi:hypothetical protein